jgi:hypothetical protein
MLTLATTPELEAQLQNEAQKFGVTLEQHALEILTRSIAPAQPELSDEQFDTVWDEAQEMFADLPFGTRELRALKEEELAVEEAKHARLFGRGSAK